MTLRPGKIYISPWQRGNYLILCELYLKTIILFNAIFKENIFWALFFAFVISFLSYFLKFLTKSGAIATFFLAVIIFGLGSWKWTVPIFTFFILSSLLSKIREKKRLKSDFSSEGYSFRNYAQVLANGGTGGILVIINQFIRSELLFIIYAASIAAVCADTWATEIGNYLKVKTINIINLKEVEPGISGGVSILGIIGAFTGSMVIGLISILWIDSNQLRFLLLITLSGFLGSIVDSLLGATVQVQFKCKNCGEITEQNIHCGSPTLKANGYYWINNNTVNLAAGISGVLFFIFFNIVI